MKKFAVLLLAAALVLALCGCGKSDAAKAVEEKINAIGEVSLDSADAILAAEEAFGALSSDEKNQVENLNVLIYARQSYDRLAEEERLKPIPLTLYNYQQYLDISIIPSLGTRQRAYDNSYVFWGLDASVNVYGASSNYNYNNVTLTIRITGFAQPHRLSGHSGLYDVDKEFTVFCNSGGNGSKNVELIDDMLTDTYALKGYEVISVSGEVAPAR